MSDFNSTLGIRLGATVLAGILALATVASLIATIIATLTSSPEPPLPQSGDFPYAQTLIATSIIVVPLLLAPLMFHSRGFAVVLPPAPALPRLLAATGLTWLAMGSTGVANSFLQIALGDSQFEGLGVTDRQMMFLAFNAGVSEEAAYLAAPSGLLFLAGSLLNHWRDRTGKRLIPQRTLWIASATAGPVILLAGRATGHLYQGSASAILGVVWGASLIAIFVWVRSIWPLMLGHVIYDLPVHFDSWPELISYHVIAPALISVFAIVLIRRTGRHQNFMDRA